MGAESYLQFEKDYFRTLVWTWIILGAVTFIVLFILPAPYGRHNKKGWGPQIPSWIGWILMEAPSPLVLCVSFLAGKRDFNELGSWTLLALWNIHYFHRSFLQPLTNPGGKKPMPLVVCGSAIFFNVINGYINGRGLVMNAAQYGADWFKSPKTVIGLGLFFTGWGINHHADSVLLSLRKPGETGYKIPYGGLYNWISCPNYLGEIIEWMGFAIAAWSLPSLSFALWTAANLVPRALMHHKWYKENMPDYPKDRGALLPRCFKRKRE